MEDSKEKRRRVAREEEEEGRRDIPEDFAEAGRRRAVAPVLRR